MSGFDPLSFAKLPIIQMVENQSVQSSMEEEFPAPELIYDGLLPRYPELDTFTRPVSLSERRVLTTRRPETENGTRPFNRGFINGLISTVVESSQSELVELNGTGTLLSPSIVFTCEHLLTIGDYDRVVETIIYRTEEDFFQRRRGLQAKRIPLPREIFGLYSKFLNCSSRELRLRRRDSLDFAVIELLEPIGHRGPFLELPSSPIVYQSGTVVCLMGLPGRPPLHPASVFSSYVRDWYKVNSENPRAALNELLHKSLFDFKVPIASFGAVDIFGSYYIPCNASMYAGMSGGPVVSLDKPDELFGIVCSSYDGMGENYFIRADCDIIRCTYEWAVSSEHIHYQ